MYTWIQALSATLPHWSGWGTSFPSPVCHCSELAGEYRGVKSPPPILLPQPPAAARCLGHGRGGLNFPHLSSLLPSPSLLVIFTPCLTAEQWGMSLSRKLPAEERKDREPNSKCILCTCAENMVLLLNTPHIILKGF